MNQLEQLKRMTTVVADTGDFHQMERFAPREATTNPSLILKAVQKDDYRPLLDEVMTEHGRHCPRYIADRLLIAFGIKILRIIPGRVSTEVDARLSFDSAGMIEQAHDLIALYGDAGIGRDRILIKLPATWEGIQAAEVLQKEGIACNMTLLFSLVQAAACAEARVQLISPFVGRILDWYKKAAGASWNSDANEGANDPGVRSVQSIFDYYKQFGYRTEIMGASFRSKSQVLALAGCDLLTISPELLAQLQASEEPVERKLVRENGKTTKAPGERIPTNESAFRYAMNDDAMAGEKLAEGIRQFAADAIKLESIIESLQ